jgi:hypothetical protein
MSGSHLSLIVMPIVIALALASWISLVYYAMSHPAWKHHSRPPRTEVAGGAFEANAGGRQLAPIWGERPASVPGPRPAAGAESYHPADAATEDQARAAAAAGSSRPL